MYNNFFNIKTIFSLVACVFLSSLASSAYAGLFTVTPVRIYMSQKDKAVAVTIVNDGETELLMQADLYLWKQNEEGQDELTLTEDMFLAPPIIKMAPKSRQVVRLARLSPSKSDEQLTYRMIVREIPEAHLDKKNMQLQIALAFSMPVFITPVGAKPKLSCIAKRVSADAIEAVCENKGTAYTHPTSIQLDSGNRHISNDVGGYILPHMKRSFKIKSDNGLIAAGVANFLVTLDDATTEKFDINIPQ